MNISYSESLNSKVFVTINFSRMKYLEVTLAILAAVSINQIEAQLSTVLIDLEDEINNTIHSLTDYRYSLGESYSDDSPKFINIWIKTDLTIVTAVNNTLREIQEMIQEAHEEGLNAEECYDLAVLALRDTQRELLSVLRGCFGLQKIWWAPLKNRIEIKIAEGRELQKEFIGVKERCHNSESELFNEETCISLQILETVALAEQYKLDAEIVIAGVVVATNDVYKYVAKCTRSPMASFKNELYKAVDTANECIKSV